MADLTYELLERDPTKKPLTVIRGLPQHDDGLRGLLKHLKLALHCNGCLVQLVRPGGTEWDIHLQGDQRERARRIIERMEWHSGQGPVDG